MRDAVTVFLVAVLLVGASDLTGCRDLIPEPSFVDSVNEKLARCRGEGRDAGTYDAYEACKKREGLQGVTR